MTSDEDYTEDGDTSIKVEIMVKMYACGEDKESIETSLLEDLQNMMNAEGCVVTGACIESINFVESEETDGWVQKF